MAVASLCAAEVDTPAIGDPARVRSLRETLSIGLCVGPSGSAAKARAMMICDQRFLLGGECAPPASLVVAWFHDRARHEDRRASIEEPKTSTRKPK